MNARPLLGIGPLVLLLGLQGVGPAGDPTELDTPGSTYFELQEELAGWRAQHGPSWRAEFEPATGHARFLWGGAVAGGFAPRDGSDAALLARAALASTRALHGVDPSTLVLDGSTFLPLSFAGSSDKWSVRFTQALGGLPVLGGSVNVLLDARGALLAVDAQALTDVSTLATAPALSAEEAVAVAEGRFLELAGQPAESVGEPALAVAQDHADKLRAPRLVWSVALHSGGGESVAHGWRLALDAHTGVEVARERLVHEFDVSGQVRSLATPGVAPDGAGNPETSQPMPYLRVTSAQGNATTDANGNFNIVGATAPLSVTVVYEGTYAATNHQPGADYSLTTTLNASGGNLVTMNPAASAAVTAEANAFAWIGWMRDWTRAVNPADATSDFLAPANVNLPQTCNAYYDGVSVNFYGAGGGCANTAYSTVVLHEMGHWLNDLYGSGNGPDGFGEGCADVYAMYMTDTPIVGQDFCGTGCHVRDGNNTTQYCGDGNGGCYGQVHADGEVLMGALWKVRTRLKNALGQSAGSLAADTLFNAWLNAYDDGQIDSIIELHWLALDDDDGDIANGTPNYSPIDLGFRDQGFPGYDLPNLSIANVTALPDTQDEQGPYTVDADIVAQFFPPVVAPTLEWRLNGGAWNQVAMLATGGDGYTADIPGQASPAKVEYRVTAEDGNGNSGTSATQQFLIGLKTLLFSEDFEGGVAGWTHGQFATQDDWQRSADVGVAGTAGKSGDPLDAFSGTNVWGNDLGVGNFNGAYQNNVHNWLRSPPLDFTGEVGTTLRFQRWLTVEKGVYDQARVLVDGIEVWSNPDGVDLIDTAWTLTEVDISSAADGKSGVVIEFRLQSDGGLVFGGWNIDDVEVFTLEAGCSPPAPSDPALQSACVGTPATFTTVATGSGPFTYQWRKDGAPIPGATAVSHTIPAVQNADAGLYSVTVDNACGSVTTAGAALLVNQPTTASTPSGATVCVGAGVQFTTAAGGTGPFSYQWNKDGLPIPGATASLFGIDQTQLADSGSYTVDVTGVCGTVTSGAAVLVVNAPTTASTPADHSVCAGLPVSFATTAGGMGPFSYQWRKDGAPIAGATASSFSIPAAQAGDAGAYSVDVTGACGTVTSAAAQLVVDAATTASDPLDQTVCAGSPASFATTAGGSGPLTFQWLKDGAPIPGATSSSLSIPAAQAADAGAYSVEVSGGCGTLTTAAALLVVDATTTASDPLDLTLCAGEPASFSTSAGGTGPFTYQWLKDGAPLAGATSATLDLPAVGASDAGAYSVQVSGACGSLETTAATLVVDQPVGASAPADQSACLGEAVSFATTASGTGPFTYQWRKDGVDLPGETGANLDLPAVSAADAGLYSVVVGGACGSLETPTAELQVTGVVSVYCTAKVSSNLCVPTIAASGLPSLSAPSGFTVTTTALESGVVGLDIYGTNGGAALPFQGGLICIASPVRRLSGKPTGGAATCSGSLAYTLADVLAQPAHGVTAGGTLNLQTWTRDLGDAFGSSLSDAVEVTICP